MAANAQRNLGYSSKEATYLKGKQVAPRKIMFVANVYNRSQYRQGKRDEKSEGGEQTHE